MDIVIIVLLNLVALVIGFLVLASRLDRQYNAQKFLLTVQSEAERIMAVFNHSADDNLRILESRMDELSRLKDECGIMLTRLEAIKGGAGVQSAAGSVSEVTRMPRQVPVPAPSVTMDAPSPIVVEDSPAVQDPRDKVLRLHHQGLDAGIIAQRTLVPLGEVELIISLHGGR